MSDFGAEVIKIEPPGTGDPYRRRATPPVGSRLASNPGFVLDGRNKKSLALDLRSPAGQAVLRRLVGDGDLWRHRHRTLSARAHRQGRLCRVVLVGQWAVGEWLFGAGGPVRRQGRAATAAGAGVERAQGPLPLPRRALAIAVDCRRRMA